MSKSNSLQAAAAAISVKGVRTFFTEAIEILMQQTISAPDKPGVVKFQTIPLGPGITLYMYNIDLLEGEVSQLSARLRNVVQKPGGIFSVGLNASFSIAYKQWKEQGTVTSDTHQIPFDHTLDDFWFKIASIDLNFDITLGASGGKWSASVTNPVQSNVQIEKIHVPWMSLLNDPASFSCINDKIKEALASTIKNVDFAKSLADALNGFLKTIPTSGKLTDHITFNFPPTFLRFPAEGGLSAGISGAVQYDSETYAGTEVNVPEAISNVAKDLVVNLSSYEFNALLWSFNKSGFLDFTLLPEMLPDPQILNTTFYKKLWPALYQFAPDSFLIVEISAIAAPSVKTDTSYWLSPAILEEMKSRLSTTAYQALKNPLMFLVVYPNLESFGHALQSLMTAADFTQYSDQVKNKSANVGLFVETHLLLTVYALKANVKTFAVSFGITKKDILLNYQLTASANVQSVKFNFGEYDTSATLVRSAIGEVDPVNINLVWAVADSAVNVAIAAAGLAGIPLPFIKGFLFKNASITTRNGLVKVETDVSFGSLRKLFTGNENSLVANKSDAIGLRAYHLKKQMEPLTNK